MLDKLFDRFMLLDSLMWSIFSIGWVWGLWRSIIFYTCLSENRFEILAQYSRPQTKRKSSKNDEPKDNPYDEQSLSSKHSKEGAPTDSRENFF